LSPVAAIKINRHHFGAVREMVAVARTSWAYRPFGIIHEGQRILVDSLIFGNIDRMAK
jgi:diacylglycerol kinase (ATP)